MSLRRLFLKEGRCLIFCRYWMAPEVIRHSNYDFKADIWSLGITIFEIATGNPPFSDKDPMQALLLIPRSAPARLEGNYSKSLKEFVTLCLHDDPAQRPTAEDLLKHRFIKSAKKGTSSLQELIKRFRQWKSTHKELSEDDLIPLRRLRPDKEGTLKPGTAVTDMGWEFDTYRPMSPTGWREEPGSPMSPDSHSRTQTDVSFVSPSKESMPIALDSTPPAVGIAGRNATDVVTPNTPQIIASVPYSGGELAERPDPPRSPLPPSESSLSISAFESVMPRPLSQVSELRAMDDFSLSEGDRLSFRDSLRSPESSSFKNRFSAMSVLSSEKIPLGTGDDSQVVCCLVLQYLTDLSLISFSYRMKAHYLHPRMWR